MQLVETIVALQEAALEAVRVLEGTGRQGEHRAALQKLRDALRQSAGVGLIAREDLEF